ncbi:MAG: mechanosensitive ion channel [Leptolyngbya sp. SIO4C5]|uniref:mechanosensitive ion channel family protein n=1 Tax=Sphaerothrix gracilis TaxID=3151835 RepID=UPI0013C04ABA|nr:mechanosensitive ion channel [Leptolyngbya sp. SIO4C5]
MEGIANLEMLTGQLQAVSLELMLRLASGIAILFVGRWGAAFLQRLLKRLLFRAGIEPTLIAFAKNIVYYGIVSFAVLIALGQMGIETTSLIAAVGAAGLAVGLALQGSLSNFAAGALIILFHPFRVGDWIEGCEASGYVEDIQLLTTVIRTLDNRTVIVPNSNLMSHNIINYSAQGKLRVDLVVGVAYSEDIDRVKAMVQEELAQDSRVLSEPSPTVGVLELADSSVSLAVRPWTRTEDYWPVYFGTLENLKKRFDREGIKIPFPQRDVHLFQNN